MNSRMDQLIEDLRREVAAVQLLIEEVIHMAHISRAVDKSESRFQDVTLMQQKYYQQTNLPLTPDNIAFLQSNGWDAQQYQASLSSISQNIDNNRVHHEKLRRNFDLRMKPLNDLVTHVSDRHASMNTDYIDALLNTARVLNPEGCILDRIKMIGNIITNIVTLHFSEVSYIWSAQSRRNQLRCSINGLFKSTTLDELSKQKSTHVNQLRVR